jgi:arabinan endo-1,5-alpha-L-arabinosidase
MPKRLILGSTLVIAAVLAAASAGLTRTADAAALVGPGVVTGNITVHDPSMVRRPDGTYLVLSTAPGLAIRTSTDRTRFNYAGLVWPGGAPWTDTYTGTSNGNLWAPDISLHNGKYYLYYAASSFGSNRSAIFLATSSTGMPGTWTNQGLVYSTTTSSNHNAIDPNLYVGSDGRWWLSLGSFWTGIKQIQLDPATGKRLAGSTLLNSLAARPGSTALEAPALFRRGSYYYLFMSWDLCCRGASSTYRIMVGRSTSVNGPFVDRNGTALTSGGGTQLLASSGRYIGPGGQSVISDPDSDLLVYHYYDGQDNGTAKLGINLLGWDSGGWPYVH